jgi:pentatricopeptide repeat protein
MNLQELIDNLNTSKKTLDEYNTIIKLAVEQREFATVVYLYDHMKNKHIPPNNETYTLINKLHSKTLPENKTIKLSNLDSNLHLQPRRRIHKIMKGYNYSDNYTNVKKYIPDTLNLFYTHPDYKSLHKDKLVKILSDSLKITMKESKLLITALKRGKYISI